MGCYEAIFNLLLLVVWGTYYVRKGKLKDIKTDCLHLFIYRFIL